LDFQIFKFFVADWVEKTNVHRHTNFVKIGQTVAEISHLTILKMQWPAILDFLKFDFLNSCKLWRTNMCHHAKFHHNRSNGCGDIAFNVFQNGDRPLSWIC